MWGYIIPDSRPEQGYRHLAGCTGALHQQNIIQFRDSRYALKIFNIDIFHHSPGNLIVSCLWFVLVFPSEYLLVISQRQKS